MCQSKTKCKKGCTCVWVDVPGWNQGILYIPGHTNKNVKSNRRTMLQKRSVAISKKCHPALKNSFRKESLKNCNSSGIFPHQFYWHNLNVTMWIYSTPTLFSMRGSPFLTLTRSHALFIRWVVWGQGGAQYLATASTKAEHSQFRCPFVRE